MKLSDIKKLKVAELRTRLQELGLDGKGLKAELVGRLWSAAETGQTGTNLKTLVSTPTDPLKVEAGCATSSSTSTDSPQREEAPCCPDNNHRITTRELTDTGTQTEPDTGCEAPRPGCGLVSKSVTEHQADDGGEADGRPRGEDTGRGRAFYEFKEEIRYKR